MFRSVKVEFTLSLIRSGRYKISYDEWLLTNMAVLDTGNG